jgi:dephospho-CoA kinase
MDPVIRIALSGKMRSGKDTVADYLVRRHGFTKFAFADKLKELAEELFGMKRGEKNRALLQTLGWRMCQIDQTVWVRQVLGRIPLSVNAVVSDLRYPIEYQMLAALDFRMVRIDISPRIQWRRIVATDPDMPRELLDDMSEVALDDCMIWDYVLDGGESLPILFSRVDILLELEKRMQREG